MGSAKCVDIVGSFKCVCDADQIQNGDSDGQQSLITCDKEQQPDSSMQNKETEAEESTGIIIGVIIGIAVVVVIVVVVVVVVVFVTRRKTTVVPLDVAQSNAYMKP